MMRLNEICTRNLRSNTFPSCIELCSPLGRRSNDKSVNARNSVSYKHDSY